MNEEVTIGQNQALCTDEPSCLKSVYMQQSAFEVKEISKPEQWLIEVAREVGLDCSKFSHEITSDFKRHVIKRHGNEKTETSSGQIPIQEADFERIPDIVKSPNYVLIGAKSKGRDILVYVKTVEDGTFIYVEEVLNSKRNKSLRGKTMYKRKNKVDCKQFFRIISSAIGTDTTNAKIISPGATGGYPDFVTTATSEPEGTQSTSLAVATSAETQGLHQNITLTSASVKSLENGSTSEDNNASETGL